MVPNSPTFPGYVKWSSSVISYSVSVIGTKINLCN